jgi:tetratricopeptide (TPR) repeat protein
MQSAHAGLEGFREWEREPRYQHSVATEWTKRGDRFLEDGDVDKALPLYTQAITLDKKFVPAYSNRAECFIDLSRNREAIDDLHRAIALEGKSAYHALRMLARLELDLRHYTQAFPVVDQLVKQGKTDGLLEDRAKCYVGLGKLDLAIADYTEALKYTQRKDLPLYERALLYDRLHQYDKVVADCSEIIKRDPEGSASTDAGVKVLTLRAQAYRKLGKDALVKKDLEHIQRARAQDIDNAPFRMK